MCGRRCLCVVSICASLLAYYLYQPVPHGISEPFNSAIMLGSFRIMHDLGWLGGVLGYDTEHNTIRKLYTVVSALDNNKETNVKVHNITMEGVPVRVYDPDSREPKSPAVVYFHGGGWVFGNLETHDGPTRGLAVHANMLVVSVDYRLAPEHPYPAGLDDCVAVTAYLINNAREYGVDPARVAIMGDSAGGGLVGSVALRLRDNPHLTSDPIKAQVYVYPMLQSHDLLLPSYEAHEGVVIVRRLTAMVILFYMGEDISAIPALLVNNHTTLQMKRHYATKIDVDLIPKQIGESYRGYEQEELKEGDAALANRVKKFLDDPYFAPLMAENYEGLPPAFLATMGFDGLRYEGIIYAKRMERSKVKVTWKDYPDGYHGALGLYRDPNKAEVGLRLFNDIVHFLKETM